MISKGYKWFKVETPEGYENKIEIKEVPQLELKQNYKAKAQVIWKKIPYGYDVTYTNVQDLSKINSFCISCRTPIENNKILCENCENTKNIDPSQIKAQFCNICGYQWNKIDFHRPLCKHCYYNHKNNS